MTRPQAKRKRRSRAKKKDLSHVGRITIGALAGFAAVSVLAFFALLWTPVQAADGSGTMTVDPREVVAGSTGNTLTFTFTAEETMASGDVALTAPAGWSAPQGSGGTAGYTTVQSSAGIIGNVEDEADVLGGWNAGHTCSTGIAVDTAIYHEATGSIRCDTGDQTTTDVWYRNIPLAPEDWTKYTQVGFWIRSSVKFESGALVFSISDQVDLGNQLERLPFQQTINADTWTYVSVRFEGNPDDRRAIRSYGFIIEDEKLFDNVSVWVDDVILGPGSPTFPGGGVVRARLLQLDAGQTVIFTYGAGGGAGGATAPGTSGESTFLTRTRISDAGRLTAIADSPVVSVLAPATTFVILDPTDGTVDAPISVTVQAQRMDDTVDTYYQEDVTLVADGSATGDGLVDIVNGVGTMSLSDTAPETVHLSLADTEGTGLDVSSTQDVVFSSGAAAPPPPGPAATDPTLEIPNEIEAIFEEGSCSPDTVATLHIHAHSTGWYRIGLNADLSDLPWLNFPGTEVHEDVQFPEEDGTYVTYFELRSPTFQVSPVQEISIRVDRTGACAAPAHEHELRDGQIVAPSLEEACSADYSHAFIEPYLVSASGRLLKPGTPEVRSEQRSAVVTLYGYDTDDNGTFDDLALEVERIGATTYVHVHGIMLREGFQVRGTVLAGEIPIDDLLLWENVLTAGEEAMKIDLDAYPEICSTEKVYHPHPGDLVRAQSGQVAYIGTDFRRHTFPEPSVLVSWFGDAPQIRTWPNYHLARFPVGQNVTIRPGRAVQVRTTLEYHLVAQQRTLRRVLSEGVLQALFGPTWAQTSLWLVDTIFFGDYTIGQNVADVTTVQPVPSEITIDQELGLQSLGELLGGQPQED